MNFKKTLLTSLFVAIPTIDLYNPSVLIDSSSNLDLNPTEKNIVFNDFNNNNNNNNNNNDTCDDVTSNTKTLDSLSVACWNLQIFGKSKAKNNDLLDFYDSMLSNYDISIVQEIRDKSGTAFKKLANLLPEYNFVISSRAGRSNSKEQYGVFYKNSLSLDSIHDFNSNKDNNKYWERPPLELFFSKDNYSFSIYTIHTKPDDVQEELSALEDVIDDTEGNILIIGDLNADCNYYNNSREDEFDSWNWIISDYDDTTVARTDCAYDRIILNSDFSNEYRNYGIVKKNINKKVSDHYLVWVSFSPVDN